MNQSVPTWNMDSSEAQKRSLGADNDLVELLWRNGQVVQHTQTHRKPAGPTHTEIGYKKKLERDGEPFMNMNTLIEEDETASWIQYPLEDSLAGDFCSNFFCELTNSQPVEKEKAIKHFGSFEDTNGRAGNVALRLQQQSFRHPNSLNFVEDRSALHISNSSHHPNSGRVLDRVKNFSHFSRPIKAEIGTKNVPVRGSGPGLVNGGDVGEPSVMTIGSSRCGSNQLWNEDDRSRVSSNGHGLTGMFKGPVKENNRKTFPQSERGLTETLETTITSSSGGSYGGTEKESTHIQRSKRKGRDADESECQSEDTNSESAGANKASQRSGSTRRSRAAEVHNLSERRRRDRINEKMRALQELIPHCNKSDKASMLDEAIEYLKSLQLQVQMMWMGSGMAPMMFPGVQHYISRMGMGMRTHPSLPSIHNPMQLPRMPLVDQSTSQAPLSNQPAMCPSVLNGINFQNGMQTPDFSQPYARQMGFQHMQAPQPTNMYGFGSQIALQSPKIGLHSSSATPFHGGAPADCNKHQVGFHNIMIDGDNSSAAGWR